MTEQKSIRFILLVVVSLALLTSSRQQSLAQKSFVRTVLLESSENKVKVGLIYQDVAASADASEAGEVLRLAAEEAATLEEAFAAAEELLPQKADYKLCDYLMLCGPPDYAVLQSYQQLLLEETEQGRLAAYVYASDGDLSFFEQTASEEDSFLSDWMDTLQLRKENCLRLYELAQGVTLLPLLSVEKTDTPYWHSGAWLLSQTGCAQKLDAAGAQMLFLLRGQGRTHRFLLQGEKFELSVRTIGKTSDTEGNVSVLVQAQVQHAKTAQNLAPQLEALAQNLLSTCQSETNAFLGLQGVRAMAGTEKEGSVRVKFALSGLQTG